MLTGITVRACIQLTVTAALKFLKQWPEPALQQIGFALIYQDAAQPIDVAAQYIDFEGRDRCERHAITVYQRVG
jgi:hypothetical protein